MARFEVETTRVIKIDESNHLIAKDFNENYFVKTYFLDTDSKIRKDVWKYNAEQLKKAFNLSDQDIKEIDEFFPVKE